MLVRTSKMDNTGISMILYIIIQTHYFCLNIFLTKRNNQYILIPLRCKQTRFFPMRLD